MYARGMSQRDIAETIEEIYGFEISSETISKITDRVLDQVEEWQNRPLKKFYNVSSMEFLQICLWKNSSLFAVRTPPPRFARHLPFQAMSST